MVTLDPIPVSPKRAGPGTIDWDNAVYAYDRDTDTFSFYLFGRQHPSVVFHTGNVADLLVDPQTEVIVGYQIEGYRARAVYEAPWLLLYAGLAGISDAEVEAIRRRMVHDHRKDLAAAFDALVEPVARRSA